MSFPDRDGRRSRRCAGSISRLGTREARHRRRIGLGQIADRARDPGPDRAKARVVARQTPGLRRHRPAARLAPRALRAIRGRRAGLVLQDPKFSLNPVMTIGDQIAETLRAHARVSRAEAARRRR